MLKQKKTEEEIALLTGEPEEAIRELIAQIRSEASEEGKNPERLPGEKPKGGDTGEHLRI